MQNKTIIVYIGDKVLRRSTNRDENDEYPWVETTVNETYLKLIHEFPEDYRWLDGRKITTSYHANECC